MLAEKPAIVNARPLAGVRASGLIALYRKSQHERADLALVCDYPNRPLLRGTNERTMQASLFKPDCGTWGCPACARRNVARVRHLITFGAVAVGRIQPLQFVTLTSHERLATADATFDVMGKAWNKLNRRFKREAERIGSTVYYVQVPEQHKSGRWHLHMISSPALSERWWKNNARACGLGYQARVAPCEIGGRAGQYMIKYLKKSLINSGDGWGKSMRRVRRSNNWPVSEQMRRKPEGWDWGVLPKETSVADEVERLRVAGYRVMLSDSAIS